MSEQANDSVARLPCIKVHWDPQSQKTAVEVDPLEFRDLHFIIGILEAARCEIELRLRMQVQAMVQQQAMQAAQQQQNVRRGLREGRA